MDKPRQNGIGMFTELDRKDWEIFRSNNKSSLNRKEFGLICELHAKYFNHRYYEPCTCNPKTIKTWIRQLNDVYERNNDNE